MNRIAVFAFIVFVSGFVSCSVRAQFQSRVALLVGENAAELVSRVRGQTADLDWSLKVDTKVEISDASDAIAVGETREADVVIWFDVSSENRVVVNTVIVATGRGFRRPVELEGDETKLSTSATVEAAALVVRSLLIALDRNQEGDTIAQAPLESTPATRSPSAQNTTSNQRSTTESSQREGSRNAAASSASKSATVHDAFEWQFVVGWHVVADGVSPDGQHGPHLRLGFNRSAVLLAVAGYLTFPAEIENDALTLELQRYSLSASIGYEFFTGSQLRLSTSLAAGILLITRSTTVHVSGLNATPDATVSSLVIQWDTRAQWFPLWVDGIAGLEFFADLAVIPASVDFGIRDGEQVLDRRESWTVQPSFCVAFVLRLD